MRIGHKRRVIIPEGLKETPVGSFFKDMGLELDSKFEESHEGEYAYIVNDFCPEILDIPRLKINTDAVYTENMEAMVRGSIRQENVEDQNVLLLVKSFFVEDYFDVIECFSKDFKLITSIKVHDYLNVGYFIDTIVFEAYKAKFDYDLIRKYLNTAFEFAFQTIEGKKTSPVIDVEFSYTENVFAVNLNFVPSGFNFSAAFETNSEIFSDLTSECNYLNINYFGKREKLKVSSAWLRGEKSHKFKSFLLNETKDITDPADVGRPRALGIEPKEKPYYQPRIVNEEEVVEVNPEDLASRIDSMVYYITTLRKKEKNPKALAELSLSDIDEYLSYHPRKDIVESLNENARTRILQELLGDTLKNVNGEENEIVTEVVGYDDFGETVVIKKVTQKIDDGFTKVAGSNDEEPESLVRIKGVTENINQNEKWDVKRSGTGEPDERGVFNNLIGREKVSSSIPELDPNATPAEKLERKLAVMKKINEQMKSEMFKLKDKVAESFDMKKALASSVEMIKNKEKMAAKARADFDQIMSAKDKKLEELEIKLYELKTELDKTGESADKDAAEQLRFENASLLARLELANKKISTINENLGGSGEKRDTEVENLKASLSMAQKLIEQYKQERNANANKLMEESFNNPKPSTGGANSEQLEIVIAEKQMVEDRLRLQGTELKKLEQKFKAVSNQLEELQKKGGSPSAAGKVGDTHAKQLEVLNGRLTDMNSDLIDKKMENHKLKQENTVLSTKVAELTKKLGFFDKKAG